MPELIPVNANVHYKTAFDIVIGNPEPMTYARQTVLQWCYHKTACSDDLLRRRWFWAGNNPSLEPAHYLINDHQIRTAAAPSENPREPHCWALEVIHGDADEPNRRWSVEVVLKQVDTGRVTFTTVVSNWITPFFIGDYPSAPSPSVPRYVSALVQDHTIQCLKGSTVLVPGYSIIGPDKVRALYDKIKSQERFVPYVVMSHHPATDGPLLDPLHVGTALVGSANTYVLGSCAVNDELNFYLDHAYALAPGSIRVFLPGLDKAMPHDCRRHRWLSEALIAERGNETIIRYLTNGLCRNASSFHIRDLVSFSDVLAERRKQKIAHLARERESLASEKRMTAADVSLLWDEIETLTRTADEWQATAQQIDAENTDLRRLNGTLNQRVTEADRLRTLAQDLTTQLNGLKALDKFPANLSDLLQTISQLFPERIVVTDQAYVAARRHCKNYPGTWEKLEGVCIAWKMLHSLAITLHRLKFDERVSDLEDAYNSLVNGVTLALTETGTTRRDRSLMAFRSIEWSDRAWDISPHLKYGRSNPDILRLHFAFDTQCRRFVVGHFGEHLPTSSTRTMA
jgi:hypothetical protein